MGPVVAIVPAFNEEATVGDTVQALHRCEAVDLVMVVDDGSSDDTARRGLLAGAEIVRCERNRGKAAAIVAGLRTARAVGPSIVAFADADLAQTASELTLVIHPVRRDEADMAVAGFPKTRRGGIGLAVGLARTGVACLTGVRLAWPLSGQRAMRADALYALLDGGIGASACDRWSGVGFGLEVALAIDWLSAGYNIVEVPTQMRHRDTGMNAKGIIHRGKQFWAVAAVVASRAFH
ncbi:MAG: glycosyltransferase family 2 protein [Clostridia bacterium]|nr:glycosyltransferase family 2 protein [Clostridia bacterium]